ncbi:Peptidase S8 pro-domain [Trinorchestia longiramus]|nr:Peptidase S8 pro-domain [Trinorchestia longiramus]
MFQHTFKNLHTVLLVLFLFRSVTHGREYTTFVNNERNWEKQQPNGEKQIQETKENTELIVKQLRAFFENEKPYINAESVQVARENLAARQDLLLETNDSQLRLSGPSAGERQMRSYSKKGMRELHSSFSARDFGARARTENSETSFEDFGIESLPKPNDGRYGYLNEWVVHLEGGPELASSLLGDLGYRTHGQVNGFKDLYRVVRSDHPRIHKREAEHFTSQLRSHSQVVWAEQQQSKVREKRSYLDFMDPDSDRPLVRVKRRAAYQLDGSFAHQLNQLSGLKETAFEDPTWQNGYDKLFNKPETRLEQQVDVESKKRVILKRILRFPLNVRSVKKHADLSDIFNDELVDNQWYLYDTRVSTSLPRLDLGVLGAWQRNYTGQGVRVVVLDDGIDYLHDDLRENYDPNISYDFNDDDNDPYPRMTKLVVNSHGTKCAGEVAMAANNGKCGVGVAFRSSIGGIRMLDGHVSDRIEGESLSFARDKVDIVSCSWGPSDDGLTVEGPGRLASMALEKGVTEGRGGKGTIFIWASGNGGMTDDNCNADGYASSVYTTAITSASQSNKFPWYGERCASTLTSVYSSGAYSDQKIISTDLNNTCTTTFSGTSASAPLAAGIVALALEANPSLTWRDVQHLTVVSSNYDTLSNNEGWQQNALGLFFNLRFGFGLMDADKMVANAINWTRVPEKVVYSVNASQQTTDNWPLSFSGQNGAKLTFQVTGQLVQNGTFLEHVQAVLTVSTPKRGSLNILLDSPRGTRTTLLTPRDKDVSREGFLSWPFMSVHTWGEDPRGTWTLTILDSRFIFSGTKRLPDKSFLEL